MATPTTSTVWSELEDRRPQPPASGRGGAREWLNPVTLIVVCALGLSCLGLTILFSASVSFQQGPYYYLHKQVFGLGLAIGAAWFMTRINLEEARRHVWIVALVSLALLALVLVPHVGIEVKGSRRWLGLGPVRFQVSELAKLALVFCLAHYIAVQQTHIRQFVRGFLLPIFLICAFVALVVLEPDFGTAALLLAVGLTMLFVAGAKWRNTIPFALLAIGALAVLVINNPNRLKRILAYWYEDASNYQLRQSQISFAVGGTEGAGLGQGRQQMHFLPEAHTDFIFAVVGEEMGLYCTLGVVAVFMVMFVAGMLHLRKAPNLFQFQLAFGCVLLISLQAIINLGVVTGLLPTKGMSLPFISAGLSNLLLMGVLLGILINTQRAWTRSGLGRGYRDMEDLVA